MASSICDVGGLKVGHFTSTRRPTGCTVVLCEQGATAGVDVRGAAPGTRETDLLAPENTVDVVHAVLLSGGSAFGLAAADGVMRWLAERGHGLKVGAACVPIVPAAVLFDLQLGDATIFPDAAAGYAACEGASCQAPMEGSVGAGTGASVGKLLGAARAMKGGIGTASVCVNGITVGALVAVNAVGDIIDPATGRLIAGARGDDGRPIGAAMAMLSGTRPVSPLTAAATTLAIVATDARLSKSAAKKLAQISHDGLARTIKPVHTPFDGDVVFSLATGAAGIDGDLNLLGVMAAEVVEQAVLRAIFAAAGWPELPGWRDRMPP